MTPHYMLALWIDVDPATRDERDHWYIHRHIADRARLPGWRRIRRFKAIGATKPDTVAIYDVDTAAQLVSDAYLALQREVTEQDRRMRATFSNVVRGTFRVDHRSGVGEGGVVVSLRFKPDDALVAQAANGHPLDWPQVWIAQTFMPQLESLPGVVAVRLMISAPELRSQHDAHRRSGNEDAHAHWVLLVELTQDEHLPGVIAALTSPDNVQRFCPEPLEAGSYRLLYAVSGQAAS